MSKEWSQQRPQSHSTGLPRQEAVRYVLTARETDRETSYGLRVVTESDSHALREESYFFSSLQEQAACLLTHLYENAAPQRRCVSVMTDVWRGPQWEANDGPCTDPAALGG